MISEKRNRSRINYLYLETINYKPTETFRFFWLWNGGINDIVFLVSLNKNFNFNFKNWKSKMERLHFYTVSKQMKMKDYLRFPTGSKYVNHSFRHTTKNE